ncbi:hypothetical protein PSKAS_38040 [Peribacillus sp. N1]
MFVLILVLSSQDINASHLIIYAFSIPSFRKKKTWKKYPNEVLFNVLTEGNMTSLSMFHEGDSFEEKGGMNSYGGRCNK